MPSENILDGLGEIEGNLVTPMKTIDLLGVPVFLKRESASASGSHKDRPARRKVQFLKDVEGLGTRPMVLILSSSGNTAIAFATHTADIPDVKLIVVADVLSPEAHLAALHQFDHVELHVVNRCDSTGSHLAARLELIEELKQNYPSAYVIDQYGDPVFALAHELTLAVEIEAQVNGPISAILVPGGTCATLLGLDQYKRLHNRRWKLLPVDAEGSRLFDPNNLHGKRVFSGYGNGRQTEFAKQCCAIERPIRPDNLEVARMARWLLIRHELYVGPSSAAVAAAFAEILREPCYPLPNWGQVVLIMPDGGEGYCDTLHDDDWLIAKGLGKAISGP